jgi:Carboxypeptidase regulatory-like domain
MGSPMVKHKIRRRVRVFIFFPVLAVFSRATLHAQVAGGTIQGAVTDASGGAVPGAQVAITNSATNAVTNVTTNGDGFYAASNLQAGDYRVTVTAPNFATCVANDVTVGAQLQANVTLKTGSVADKVEVFAGESRRIPAETLRSLTMFRERASWTRRSQSRGKFSLHSSSFGRYSLTRKG